MPVPAPVRVLILGTGVMAADHARNFRSMPGVQVVAACDTRAEVLADFCREHGIPRGFAALADALDWGGFDAASNVTPDRVHHPTTMALLGAGKHVLCEKPLAPAYPLAREMAEAAARAGVVNVVNLSYRKVAALQKAADLVRQGALGRLTHFQSSYLQSWLTQTAWGDWRTEPRKLWRLSTAHGSQGCLGDIGVHVLDFATHVAGEPIAELACRLTTFPKAPGDRIGEYVLDANDAFTMQARLSGGAIGVVSGSRLATGHANDLYLRLHGTEGGLDLSFERGAGRLSVCLGAAAEKLEWSPVDCPEVPTNYQRFIAAIRGEAPAEPTFLRGAEVQSWLDLAERSDAEGGRRLAL